MLSRTMLGSNLWSLHYNIAESNPFLYRGYYYDRETGFYFLQSRYYDPVTGRFLNADSHVNANGDLIGYNMYAYCSNNPVMYVDPSGEFCYLIYVVYVGAFIVGYIVGSVIAAAITNSLVQSNYENNSQYENTPDDIKKVTSQSNVEKYRYGFWSMKKNGCEIIAVHNAKLLLGQSSSLSQTVSKFNQNNTMWLYGGFGTRPRDIGRVLTSMGMEYTTFDSLDEMTQDGVYIISYWTSGFPHQIHTVAVQKNQDIYKTLNGPTDDPFEYAQDTFIYGYYLGG